GADRLHEIVDRAILVVMKWVRRPRPLPLNVDFCLSFVQMTFVLALDVAVGRTFVVQRAILVGRCAVQTYRPHHLKISGGSRQPLPSTPLMMWTMTITPSERAP